MATGAVLQYLREVYSQPSIYHVWCNQTSTNHSRPENNSSLADESTELIVHDELSQLPMSAAHFGLATGLLAILLNSRLLSSKMLKTDARVNKYQQWAEALVLRVVFALVCLLLSATVAPLVAVAFFLLAFYRQFVRLVLSLTDSSFACLLEGTDAVWALEDDTSKSIINVLAFFEVEIIDNVFKPQLLGMLRRLMRERILTSPQSCPKFWQYRRRSRLGYFYWEQQKEVHVEDHVQYMTQEDDIVNLDAPDLSEDCFRQEYYGMSESVLKGLVSELANSPLPFDNAASWEILVGRDPILEDLPEMDPFEAMEEGNQEASGRYRRYPVLFRVHHSMGDGVALIKLLLETLADKKDAVQSGEGIVTAKLLGYDNEAATRLTRRKTLSRLDSIDMIKCSTGSFDDMNRSNENKARRPTFLDLSLDKLENSKKKVMADCLVPEPTEDDLSESVQMFVDNSPNMFYAQLPELLGLSQDCEVDEVYGEDSGSSIEEEVASLDDHQRDLYCYPLTETILTIDDTIHSANEIVLNHNKKTIYFDNTIDCELDGSSYKKAGEHNPPPGNRLQLFRDQSPPPNRCKSPMPPFRRDVSRIERVMDKIIESKSRPMTPPSKNDSSSPTGSESSTINLDESSRGDSMFQMDGSPPLAKPHASLPSRVGSQYIGYDAKTFARNESPVPKIHRKRYPVVYDDQDSEDSPPTSRRDHSYSRPSSPFLRDNSPAPYHGKGEPQHPRKNALRLENDNLSSRSGSPIPRNNSSMSNHSSSTSRAHSPFLRSYTPVLRKDVSPPRCHSPIMKNYSNLRDESLIPRCNSPFMRNNSPVPRNENAIPRCNSPFMRNNSPVPRNENPIPRCNSPFLRNNSTVPRNENPIPRCNSPFMRNNSPVPRNENPIPRCNSPFMRNNSPLPSNEKSFSRCNSPLMRNNGVMPLRTSSPFQNNESLTNKSKLINRKTPLYLTNSCYNPRVNDMLSKPSPSLSTVDESGYNCPFVDSAGDTKNKTSTKEKTKATVHEVPLTPTSSHDYTEQFIRSNFFAPDGEVINRSSISPNCFVKLLDSINHRPTAVDRVCNYVKNTCALVFAPAALIHQTMMKAADVNPLHGPDLSGQKVVTWYLDSKQGDTSENLLSIIKRIKGRMSEARFTDVFLSAVSSSLESYFLRSGCDSKCIPGAVSVVIPVRMTTQKEIEEAVSLSNRETETTNGKHDTKDEVRKIPAMENKFSVALLSLPMASISIETKVAKPFSPMGRLREICKHTDILRKSPDYHINYWLMRVVSTYLPVPLLAPVLNSTQSTMVVSNLVGPPTQLELGGYHLKDIVFWVPNRGSTGVGVSVLSYAGRLQIGIVADRALLPCQQDANIIIEGIVSELKCLDHITAPIKTHPIKV